MAGRGRGRGRGGAALPPSIANRPQFGPAAVQPALISRTEPKELFPTISLPQPVDPENASDLAAIRFADALSSYMKTSPYYLMQPSGATKIDRYSDKYLTHLKEQERKGKILAINADLSYFPEELHSVYDQEKAKKWAAANAVNRSSGEGKSFGDALAKLKDLEKKEATEGAAGADEEEEEEEEEFIYEEDEFEDETDYNLSYFDNGEDFGDRDDGDDGPVD